MPLSAAPCICGATLVPLRKGADGLGVRPIAVGEALRRVVGKFAAGLPSARQAAQDLLPHQCGVSVPGACETIAMGIQALARGFRATDDVVVLQVDCANAFNSVDRGAMLNSITNAAPDLAAWGYFCYGSPTPLRCGQTLLSSQQGVQQGDPLGPLFFALAW